jgi:hypothetical protein
MTNATHARRLRRQRQRRRSDLAAAYAIIAEAAPFFDTMLGSEMADAIAAGVLPDAWNDPVATQRESNGASTDRTLPCSPRSYARAF